mgnify:FL=1
MKKSGKKRIETRYIVGIAALICMLVCIVILAAGQYKRWKSQRIYDKLAQDTTVEAGTETDAESEESTEMIEAYKKEAARLAVKYGVEVPEKNIDFDRLHKEVSEDIYAWIYIPNINVDYPVFQHPTDNAYYLEHNVDGSEGYPGCIYTENYNSKDFSDSQTVIYGHNMRDGTMFSDLHKYEDEEFFDENRYVYIYTEDTVLVYKIFAAYQTNNAHQLLNFDFSKKENLLTYLENVRKLVTEQKVFDDDVVFSEDDKVLTLSTCVMKERQFHLRYLVQALRLQ